MGVEASTWLGLVAVIVGALLGYASSMLQESRRRRFEADAALRQREQEHRRRLQDLRFDAYVAMITEANRVYGAVKHPGGDDVDIAHVRAVYESFVLTLSPAFMVAADVASRDVVAALARAVRQLVDAVHDGGVAAGGSDATQASLDSLLRTHRRCVKQAESVMRAELGITDDEPAPPSPPTGQRRGAI
jgi:hypothetical protein